MNNYSLLFYFLLFSFQSSSFASLIESEEDLIPRNYTNIVRLGFSGEVENNFKENKKISVVKDKGGTFIIHKYQSGDLKKFDTLGDEYITIPEKYQNVKIYCFPRKLLNAIRDPFDFIEIKNNPRNEFMYYYKRDDQRCKASVPVVVNPLTGDLHTIFSTNNGEEWWNKVQGKETFFNYVKVNITIPVIIKEYNPAYLILSSIKMENKETQYEEQYEEQK